ncbi:MAG: HAD family hydrolase [Candidatus Helarchaeota archaeon]
MKNSEILLLFDLDFTLIDNSKGIINSFNHALEKHGHAKLTPAEIIPMIGEPLEEMFAKYSNKNIAELVKLFREYYQEKGIHELTILPGSKEKILELKNSGYRLAVLTSKKEKLARKLLKDQGILNNFIHVFGSTDERKNKNSPLIKKFLKDHFPNLKKFCMIGDHPSDGKVSELFQCPFIGLLSGNSTREQLINSTTMKKVILNNVRELNSNIIAELFV